LVAVGSGKGGVGKTILCSSLAVALAKNSDDQVTAVDVDLGGANLHAGLGIPRPSFALNHFLLDEVPLERLSAPSNIDHLNYIGGASDIVGLAEFSEAHRERFLEELVNLQSGTILLDLGAGSSLFNLDLFCLSDYGVLVTTPEPTAVQNAYGFLRAAVYRRLRRYFDGEEGLVEILTGAMNHRRGDEEDSVPGLVREFARYNRSASSRLEEAAQQIEVGVVVNMSEEKEGKEVAENLAQVAQKYLGVRLDFLGSVTWDDHVQQAIREWRPLVLHFSKSKAARDLKKVADCLWRRLEHREALTA
jgi:flagellar biosynthesis protein FlhG